MRVAFYKTESGREPVDDSIGELEKVDEAKIRACLTELRKEGLKCTKITFKPIQGKLWEIKIKTSSGGYRIFYVMIKNEIMVLLHMYKKQSQKAPKKEIKLAIKRMSDVLKGFNI